MKTESGFVVIAVVLVVAITSWLIANLEIKREENARLTCVDRNPYDEDATTH